MLMEILIGRSCEDDEGRIADRRLASMFPGQSKMLNETRKIDTHYGCSDAQ